MCRIITCLKRSSDSKVDPFVGKGEPVEEAVHNYKDCRLATQHTHAVLASHLKRNHTSLMCHQKRMQPWNLTMAT
jgi:hypothetical protein